MGKYQTIFFDFDGVLCKDRFYTNLVDEYHNVHEYIQNIIFGKDNDFCNKRMRNKLTMYDINRNISLNTNIDYDELMTLFIQSIKDMNVDKNLLKIAQQLKKQGKKIGIITNNMDVFSAITIANHQLDSIFDVIINSADYGMLKQDQEGKLFDIAMNKIGEIDYSASLLIDDSNTARFVFEQKGGDTFAYTEFNEFYNRAKENLL